MNSSLVTISCSNPLVLRKASRTDSCEANRVRDALRSMIAERCSNGSPSGPTCPGVYAPSLAELQEATRGQGEVL